MTNHFATSSVVSPQKPLNWICAKRNLAQRDESTIHVL
jgi:hypothetical protein